MNIKKCDRCGGEIQKGEGYILTPVDHLLIKEKKDICEKCYISFMEKPKPEEIAPFGFKL